jgi:general L-amino acid transport system substrate-binding protein
VALRGTAADGASFAILEQLVSREPLGPFVRSGDDAWRAIVTWTIALLTGAEEAGVSTATLPRMMTSTDPVVRRMLGVDPGNGAALGLADDWGLKVLGQVGNYAEIFDRNLGAGSPFRLERGLNALWLAGGLHYPLPLR